MGKEIKILHRRFSFLLADIAYYQEIKPSDWNSTQILPITDLDFKFCQISRSVNRYKVIEIT